MRKLQFGKLSQRILTAGLFCITGLGIVGPAAAEETIKIGAILIDSGPFANLYERQVRALNLAVDAVNAKGGALGRKFEVVVITHAGTPEAAVQAATRAVQRDGAKFLTGMFTSSISLAMSARMPALGALMIDPFSQSDVLTGKNCSAGYFRVSTNDSMIMGAVKEFIKGSPVRKWNVIATDYTAGHDAAEKFQSVVESTGGSVNKVLFAPLGTSDFGTHISQLAAAPADGLFVTIFGSDAINLAKQQAQFGLFKQFKMVLGNGFAVPANLPAQGDAVLGVQQTLSYVPEFPGKANADFVQAYRSKYSEAPNYNLADQYAAVELLRDAIIKAGSTDVGAVKGALSGLKTSTVLGDVEMRMADHQLVRPITVTEVVRLDSGELGYALKAVETGPSIIPVVDPACKL